MDSDEPNWISDLRDEADYRPDNKLALLLREYDVLWKAAGPVTRKAIKAARPPS